MTVIGALQEELVAGMETGRVSVIVLKVGSRPLEAPVPVG